MKLSKEEIEIIKAHREDKEKFDNPERLFLKKNLYSWEHLMEQLDNLNVDYSEFLDEDKIRDCFEKLIKNYPEIKKGEEFCRCESANEWTNEDFIFDDTEKEDYLGVKK